MWDEQNAKNYTTVFHALIDSFMHHCLQFCQSAWAKETLLFLTISIHNLAQFHSIAVLKCCQQQLEQL